MLIMYVYIFFIIIKVIIDDIREKIKNEHLFDLLLDFVLIVNRYYVDYDFLRMNKVLLVKQFDEYFDD